MLELGFRAYLPLHLARYQSRPREAHIVPLWRGYLFVQFDLAGYEWRRILHARGIGGLLCDAGTGQPAAILPGVIEELLGRTSDRRIVDDPGFDPPEADAPRVHWQNITSLSAADMKRQLFGREDAAA